VTRLNFISGIVLLSISLVLKETRLTDVDNFFGNSVSIFKIAPSRLL